MLHMIVNTHNPESCAFHSDQDGKAVAAMLDGFADTAAGEGVTVEGFWIDRAGHTFYILVEAANAHAVDSAMVKGGFPGRTYTDIRPVMRLEEVRAQL